MEPTPAPIDPVPVMTYALDADQFTFLVVGVCLVVLLLAAHLVSGWGK